MEFPAVQPGRFRKKPVVIEAAQVPPVHHIGSRMEFEDWLNSKRKDRGTKWSGDKLMIETLEGTMTASVGDYIICGVQGELYPCKPDIFISTYEPA